MAISSIGVGSNLDLAGLLTNLEKAESQPLVAIEAQAKSYTSKFTAYGTVQSALETFQAAAKKLSTPALFESVSGTPTVSGIVTAASTAASVAGSYNINVTQLAQSQSLVAAGQASTTTAIGSGSFTLDFGTVSGGTLDPLTGKYSGSTFTVDGTRPAKTITIDPAKSTLGDIRDAINAADAGVSATIVNDGSGTPNRLVLTSTKTGEASSMRIAVDGGADAALQNLLNNDPAGTQNLQQTAAAQSAKLTVNGIAITSQTNTVGEAIQGTTLTLLQTGTTGMAVEKNTLSAKTAINDFVKAYNALQSTAKSLTTYDADTKTGAALVGDSTLRNLQTRIRQALTTPQSGGADDMKVLSEIGVSFQKDGTLAVDATKLDKAMANDTEGVSRLFAGTGVGNTGYGKQIDALVQDLTSTGGALKTAQDGITKTIKGLDAQYDQVQARVDATVARYRAQFTQLDVLINSMNNTKAYLTQQFEAMNANAGQ